jgi:glycosyltransferase involved in cell wall biosynthesis
METPMINGKKIVVVMPAYNAEKTVETTYRECRST